MSEPWINKKDWLKGYIQRPKPADAVETTTEEITTITFVRPKCPKCGNKNLRCNGVKDNIRYFKCKCGYKFKAIEK
jgi:predicted RNA-binding Zn-ribbon protein involved in translation (DUF1610 family)